MSQGTLWFIIWAQLVLNIVFVCAALTYRKLEKISFDKLLEIDKKNNQLVHDKVLLENKLQAIKVAINEH
jgi:hypothetical protein